MHFRQIQNRVRMIQALQRTMTLSLLGLLPWTNRLRNHRPPPLEQVSGSNMSCSIRKDISCKHLWTNKQTWLGFYQILCDSFSIFIERIYLISFCVWTPFDRSTHVFIKLTAPALIYLWIMFWNVFFLIVALTKNLKYNKHIYYGVILGDIRILFNKMTTMYYGIF